MLRKRALLNLALHGLGPPDELVEGSLLGLWAYGHLQNFSLAIVYGKAINIIITHIILINVRIRGADHSKLIHINLHGFAVFTKARALGEDIASTSLMNELVRSHDG